MSTSRRKKVVVLFVLATLVLASVPATSAAPTEQGVWPFEAKLYLAKCIVGKQVVAVNLWLDLKVYRPTGPYTLKWFDAWTYKSLVGTSGVYANRSGYIQVGFGYSRVSEKTVFAHLIDKNGRAQQMGFKIEIKGSRCIFIPFL